MFSFFKKATGTLTANSLVYSYDHFSYNLLLHFHVNYYAISTRGVF